MSYLGRLLWLLIATGFTAAGCTVPMELKPGDIRITFNGIVLDSYTIAFQGGAVDVVRTQFDPSDGKYYVSAEASNSLVARTSVGPAGDFILSFADEAVPRSPAGAPFDSSVQHTPIVFYLEYTDSDGAIQHLAQLTPQVISTAFTSTSESVVTRTLYCSYFEKRFTKWGETFYSGSGVFMGQQTSQYNTTTGKTTVSDIEYSPYDKSPVVWLMRDPAIFY